MTLRCAVASAQRTSALLSRGVIYAPLLGWQSKGRKGDAMPTVTVMAACGGSPSWSFGGGCEASVSVDTVGGAARVAVVLARFAGWLGEVLVPEAVAIEPRVRGPPSLVVLVTQWSRKIAPRF